MSSINTTLRFSYLSGSNSDARTFTVTRISPSEETEFYRVRLFSPYPSCDLTTKSKFYHPITGLKIGMTTFYRQNLETQVFETAGQIEWRSNTNATVQFGIEEVIEMEPSTDSGLT